MGKSKKKTPACTWCCCKSQKRGKQISHRKFLRKEATYIITGKYELLPIRQWEILNSGIWEVTANIIVVIVLMRNGMSN